MNDPEQLDSLRRELDAKRAELDDMRRALPAHSLRPHQLSRVEELEDVVADLEERVATLETKGG